jgi:hypothetical protein
MGESPDSQDCNSTSSSSSWTRSSGRDISDKDSDRGGEEKFRHGGKIPSVGIGKQPERISIWWEISLSGIKKFFRCMDHLVLRHQSYICGDLPTPFLSVWSRHYFDTHCFFEKILDLVLAWKSGLKVPFLPLVSSCPLQTILLSDLVGFDSPLQIVMAVWHTNIFSRGPVKPDPESLNLNKKGAKLPFLSAEGCHTPKKGQHCTLITYQGVIFKGGETH